MKKLGILTSSYAGNGNYGCNYGAILQGYALITKLRELGYEAYDINYNSENVYMPQNYSTLKRVFCRIKLLFDFEVVKNKIKSCKNKKNEDILSQKFREFIAEYSLVYENGKFFDLNMLKNISNDFYAFITGSDVVWNPVLYNNKIDAGFYLDFTSDFTKRIAYAPSIGISEMPEECIEDFKKAISKLDFVSIREKSGADIVKNITGKNIEVVVDPTLLLRAEDYYLIQKEPLNLPKKYIALYKFGKLEHTHEKIKEISKFFGLPVIAIPAGENEKYDVKYDIGPGEFIHVIKNAEFVISDSFHCTVFCLLMHTPFYTFYRTMPKKGNDINSRMIDLLKSVGLANRLIKPGDEIDFNNILDIDFNQADHIIEKRRKRSLEFLCEALENKNECFRD